MLECENCGEVYDRPRKSKRRTCSRSCAVSLSWKNEETRAQRTASIIDAVNTPSNRRRISRENRKRWARQGEREKLSELNKSRWADESFKEKTSATIRDVWTAEKRAKFSEQLLQGKIHQ